MFCVVYGNRFGQRALVKDEEGTAMFQTFRSAELVAAEFREEYRYAFVIPLRAP